MSELWKLYMKNERDDTAKGDERDWWEVEIEEEATDSYVVIVWWHSDRKKDKADLAYHKVWVVEDVTHGEALSMAVTLRLDIFMMVKAKTSWVGA